jgi:hypothetical protein
MKSDNLLSWRKSEPPSPLLYEDPFATYINGAAEASRYEGSDDHEKDNSLDRSGYDCHLALIL